MERGSWALSLAYSVPEDMVSTRQYKKNFNVATRVRYDNDEKVYQPPPKGLEIRT